MRRFLKFLWILSLVAVFFLLLLPYISPNFRGYLDNLVHPFLPKVSDQFYSTTDLQKENDKLRKQLAEYESQEDYWNRLFEENKTLRDLHKMPERPKYETVLSQVTVRNPLTGKFRFMIDKGEKEELIPGMPVLVGPNLFGRILEVEKTHSVVGSLAMKKVLVYCRIKGTEVFGRLSGEVSGAGKGELFCKLIWLSRDAELKPGMVVITSGFTVEQHAVEAGAGLIPGGIEIGKIVSLSKNEKYQEAVVSLSAHWQHFDYVTVLKKK
ncbi:MAG: rod shape-determining protein MreC [Lentisphaeraceae bacterium]|nr:rod shape-determining protein MreC [Lentisphaeraceae bacterium]